MRTGENPHNIIMTPFSNSDVPMEHSRTIVGSFHANLSFGARIVNIPFGTISEHPDNIVRWF